MWPTPPQFLNQAPPGAQQLTLPDLRNVPHLGHPLVRPIVEVTDGVLIGFLTMSPRLGFVRLGAFLVTGMGADVHAVRDIDPGDPVNMLSLLAFELTQSSPQIFFLKDVAKRNISSMLVTLDTSHLEISPVNDDA